MYDDKNNLVAELSTNESQYTCNAISGIYTLEVSKTKHCTREYTVIASDSNVTRDVKICLLGDVNGDGKVNAKDRNRLYEHVNKSNLLTDTYSLMCADVTLDGKVNTKDRTRLYEHINKSNLLW